MNSKEFEKAVFLVANKKPGEYELKEIYGTEWCKVESPQKFGKEFKKFVQDGKISGIRFVKRKTDNHSTYVIGEFK